MQNAECPETTRSGEGGRKSTLAALERAASSGAAGSHPASTGESSETPLLPDHAAPEDGRSPVQAVRNAGGAWKMRPGDWSAGDSAGHDNSGADMLPLR